MVDDSCTHNTIIFASGDYYMFCADCRCWWIMKGDGDEADVDGKYHNKGQAVFLSGEERVKK